LGKAAVKAGAEVWAYCLMPNHVHAIVTPKDGRGLRRTFGDLHRRYTAQINERNRRTRAHLAGRDDCAVTVAPVMERVGPLYAFLGESFDEVSGYAPLRVSETTGRPVGSEDWIRQLEKAFVRPLAPLKRGPKPQQENMKAAARSI
jgi:putative transposase